MARVIISRRCFSALYITRDKAQANYVVLMPIIDFEARLLRKSELIKSVEARKLDINVNQIEERWKFYKMIDDHKNVLEATRNEINNLIGKLKQEQDEKNKDEIEKLQMHAEYIRSDLKNVKDYSYGVEENANLAVLSLPNYLHRKTPLDNITIIYESGKTPDRIDKDHLEIGNSLNLIEFVNAHSCFLKSDAALLEIALTNYFHSNMRNIGFTQFSNADFARSVIVEGCGLKHLDNNRVFTIKTDEGLNKLHLVGGASLHSFMAYFAKNSIQSSFLPLRYFANGRKYMPSGTGKDLLSLYQNTVMRIFMGVEDDSVKAEETFDTITQEVIKLYEPLGYHFRVVYAKASELDLGESLKVSIQMFSNFLGKYIEVGHLGLYDDFLSKRLLVTYSIQKERKFVRIISGELLNVHRFLACAIENNHLNKNELLPDSLQKYLYLK